MSPMVAEKLPIAKATAKLLGYGLVPDERKGFAIPTTADQRLMIGTLYPLTRWQLERNLAYLRAIFILALRT
jgi:hypothetical protein